MSGRVVIFAGAGASKAVNAEQFPTTVEFFKIIPDHIKNMRFFRFAEEFLRRDIKSDEIDIEMILWAIQTIRDDFSNLLDNKYITGSLFQSGILNNIIQSRDMGSISEIIRQVKSECDDLIDDINSLVYEIYSYEPEIKEIENNWLNLISDWDGVGKSLEIITTNYDIVIESALTHINGPETARQWFGIDGSIRRKINFRYWDNALDRHGRLTKLHGSLDWKKSGKEIHVGDAVFTGDHEKHLIIYPGFKNSKFSEHFEKFHSYVSEVISESEVLIFIGFAFRDNYINQMIRENIDRSSRVYIINPDDSVVFPSSKPRVKYIRGYFDDEAVSEIGIDELRR